MSPSGKSSRLKFTQGRRGGVWDGLFICSHCGGELGLWRIWYRRNPAIYDEVQVIKRGTYGVKRATIGSLRKAMTFLSGRLLRNISISFGLWYRMAE